MAGGLAVGALYLAIQETIAYGLPGPLPLRHLPAMIGAYLTKLADRRGEVTAEVTAAQPLSEAQFALLTGKTPPDYRTSVWAGSSRLVFATPEVVRNDLREGRLPNLKDFAGSHYRTATLTLQEQGGHW